MEKKKEMHCGFSVGRNSSTSATASSSKLQGWKFLFTICWKITKRKIGFFDANATFWTNPYGVFMRERSDTNTLGNQEDHSLKGKSRQNKRQNEQLKETILWRSFFVKIYLFNKLISICDTILLSFDSSCARRLAKQK